MGTLVIKNLPDDLHDKLRQQAARHHRSMTREAMTLIEAGVARVPGPPAVADPGPLDPLECIGKWPRYHSIDEVNAWMDELRQDRDVDD